MHWLWVSPASADSGPWLLLLMCSGHCHRKWPHLGNTSRVTHAMSISPPPPSPTHILRSHSSPISALYISDNNNRICSGDATGTITVTSTRTLRPIAKWKAHKESILGIEEWDSVIITSVWRFFWIVYVFDNEAATREITNCTYGIGSKSRRHRCTLARLLL